MGTPIHPKILEIEAQLAAAPAASPARVDALNDLAWELWTTHHERAEALTKESVQLATALNYESGIAYARLNKGLMEWQTDVERALPLLLDALQWFEDNNDLRGEANARGILGILYWGFGDFERGFECAARALRLYREIGDENGEGWANNSLGGFYYDLNNYEKSLQYFQKAHDIFKNIDHLLGQARALNGIGNCHLQLGKCKRALVYQKQSLKILRDIEHRMSESRTLNDIGLVYQKFGQPEEALKYHRQSLGIRRELQYLVGQTTTLMDLGDLYRKQAQLDQALDFYQQALKISEQIIAKPKIVRAQKALAEIYESLGDYRKAFEHIKAYHEIEEEVFHEDAEQRLKHLKAAYQLEASKKESEIYRLRNVELKQKNDQLHDTIRELNAAQAQLIQSGKMVALGNLVAGIVHEINNPLGVIKSSNDLCGRVAKKILNLLNSDPDASELQKQLNKSLAILHQNTHTNTVATERIIKIINSLKNFARLDEAEFQKADIHEGLDNTLNLLGYEMPGTMKIIKEYGELPALYVNPGELNQVFMNLLMNAIQATPKNGKISIQTRAQNGHAVIRISDTGKGIPEEKLSRLFEPAFTSDHSRIKMRTGLYTSYNIIHRHEGEIAVKSKVGEGTTFTIRIPTNLQEVLDG